MSKSTNPRVVGLVRARANLIRQANPEARPEDWARAAHEAALRLCTQSLQPGGALTFDEAVDVAALTECWLKATPAADPSEELTEQDLREIDDRIDCVIPREDPGVAY